MAILAGMDISGYLEKHELSQEQFAKQIGVSQGLVWQWLNGHTRITAEKAVEIEKKTKGEIKRHALRPDLFAKEARVA
jgi:DNA-binding transcriptional regulator YdaS (Cro superfamily)